MITRTAVDTALASPQRALAKAATEAVLERYSGGGFIITPRWRLRVLAKNFAINKIAF
jgi:hypothetical protein